MPLSAIERVDIQLDGASAVYGADAIGGVVNFITKKNYTGLSATYREEFQRHRRGPPKHEPAGRLLLVQREHYGHGITRRIRAINNRKLWTSSDFRDQFGPEFDNPDDDDHAARHGMRLESPLHSIWGELRFQGPKTAVAFQS